MGKVVGLVGAASGKIGNLVYAVTNGIQTARVYQPVVSNPKTPLQTAQRAKGNLCGRISSFVPRAAIFGLGVNARARRGRFLSNLLNAATVTIVGGQYRAKVADNAIKFSMGSVPISVIQSAITAQANTINVSLLGVSSAVMSADTYASKLTRLVVMVYDSATNDLVEVVTKIATKPAQSATEATNLSTTHPSGYTAVVYAIPMDTNDGNAMSVSTDVAEKDDATVAASLSVNGNAVVFDYGMSVVLGTATFTPGA